MPIKAIINMKSKTVKIIHSLFIMVLGFVLIPSVATAIDNFESLEVLSSRLPNYPLGMTMEGIYKGKARVILSVDETGSLKDVYVEAYTHPEFGRLAEKYVRLWTFQPAKLNGEPISVIKSLEFDFEDKRGVHAVGVMESTADKLNFGRFAKSKRIYSPKELDKIPVPVEMEKPLFPEEFRNKNIKGSTTVIFYIDEEGSVRMPHVTEYSHENFAKVSLLAVENWKFQPPIVRGKPVSILVRQQFNFSESRR